MKALLPLLVAVSVFAPSAFALTPIATFPGTASFDDSDFLGPDAFDFEGDGTPDFTIRAEGIGYDSFYVYNLDGSVKWAYSVPMAEVCPSCVDLQSSLYAFADVDPAPGREALFDWSGPDAAFDYHAGVLVLNTSTNTIVANLAGENSSGFFDANGDGYADIVTESADSMVTVWGIGTTIGVCASGGSAPAFYLKSNRPNPFNPETRLAFTLSAAGPATLEIHDLAGRRVVERNLGVLPAGAHETIWNGTDDRGRPVASGKYFWTILSHGDRRTGQAVLVR